MSNPKCNKKMSNITLIGMAGCGKSTLGKLLAKKQGYDFVDSDEIIDSTGKKTSEIMHELGEEELLKVEEDVFLNLVGDKKIFAPGGSCIYSSKGMEHFRDISLVVFLDVAFEIIQRRLDENVIKDRGIIGLKKQTLKELFNSRMPLYEKYAHLTVKLGDNPKNDNFNILMKNINEFRNEKQR